MTNKIESYSSPGKLLGMLKSKQLNNVVSNSFWNILASIVLRGNIFLVNIIIARLLGVALFGEYALIKSTIQVFELSLGLAFGLSMTKFVSENMQKKDTGSNLIRIIKTNLISSIALSIILFIILEWSSEHLAVSVLKNEDLLSVFRVAMFYILFNNIVQCLIGILKGEENFKKIFQISLITGGLNITAVTICTFFYSLEGAILALVLFSVFQLLVYVFTLKRDTYYLNIKRWTDSKLDFKLIKKFNLPAIISGLAAPPAIWYINVSLSKTEMGYHELAYFNSAYQIFALIVFLPISISDSTFPILNKYFSKGEGFKEVFLINLLVIFLIALCVCVIPFLFPEFVMSLFGKDFSNGAIVLRYLCIAAVFS